MSNIRMVVVYNNITRQIQVDPSRPISHIKEKAKDMLKLPSNIEYVFNYRDISLNDIEDILIGDYFGSRDKIIIKIEGNKTMHKKNPSHSNNSKLLYNSVQLPKILVNNRSEVSIFAKKLQNKEELCLDCSARVLCYFCTACSMFVCRGCLITTHSNHKVFSVNPEKMNYSYESFKNETKHEIQKNIKELDTIHSLINNKNISLDVNHKKHESYQNIKSVEELYLNIYSKLLCTSFSEIEKLKLISIELYKEIDTYQLNINMSLESFKKVQSKIEEVRFILKEFTQFYKYYELQNTMKEYYSKISNISFLYLQKLKDLDRRNKFDHSGEEDIETVDSMNGYYKNLLQKYNTFNKSPFKNFNEISKKINRNHSSIIINNIIEYKEQDTDKNVINIELNKSKNTKIFSNLNKGHSKNLSYIKNTDENHEIHKNPLGSQKSINNDEENIAIEEDLDLNRKILNHIDDRDFRERKTETDKGESKILKRISSKNLVFPNLLKEEEKDYQRTTVRKITNKQIKSIKDDKIEPITPKKEIIKESSKGIESSKTLNNMINNEIFIGRNNTNKSSTKVIQSSNLLKKILLNDDRNKIQINVRYDNDKDGEETNKLFSRKPSLDEESIKDIEKSVKMSKQIGKRKNTINDKPSHLEYVSKITAATNSVDPMELFQIRPEKKSRRSIFMVNA